MPQNDVDSSESTSWCGGRGATARGREEGLWRAAGAELAGTALLVLLSCLPACAQLPTLQRALAGGLVVTLVVQSFNHISGAQVNPTVTLAAALWRRVSTLRALVFVTSQLLGAALGAALLHALRPRDALHATCVTRPADSLSLSQAVCVEALLGACLVLVNCASWDARTQHYGEAWPLTLGVSVTAMSLIGGELTGASMNPARSFGPALLSGDWTHHWVYWAGPLSGSALAALTYAAVWRPPPAARPAHPPARAPAPPARAPAPPAHDKRAALP